MPTTMRRGHGYDVLGEMPIFGYSTSIVTLFFRRFPHIDVGGDSAHLSSFGKRGAFSATTTQENHHRRRRFPSGNSIRPRLRRCGEVLRQLSTTLRVWMLFLCFLILFLTCFFVVFMFLLQMASRKCHTGFKTFFQRWSCKYLTSAFAY